MYKSKMYSSVPFYICINTCLPLRSNTEHFHFTLESFLKPLLKSILLSRVNHYSIFNHYRLMLPVLEFHMFNGIIQYVLLLIWVSLFCIQSPFLGHLDGNFYPETPRHPVATFRAPLSILIVFTKIYFLQISIRYKLDTQKKNLIKGKEI